MKIGRGESEIERDAEREGGWEEERISEISKVSIAGPGQSQEAGRPSGFRIQVFVCMTRTQPFTNSLLPPKHINRKLYQKHEIATT